MSIPNYTKNQLIYIFENLGGKQFNDVCIAIESVVPQTLSINGELVKHHSHQYRPSDEKFAYFCISNSEYIYLTIDDVKKYSELQ